MLPASRIANVLGYLIVFPAMSHESLKSMGDGLVMARARIVADDVSACLKTSSRSRTEGPSSQHATSSEDTRESRHATPAIALSLLAIAL
jgi:hypothetical protein